MAKQVTNRGKSVEQQSLSRCKPYLAFSIDSILGRNEETALSQTRIGKETPEGTQGTELKTATPVDVKHVAHLPWLSYTRYSPPKLPSEYCRFSHNFSFLVRADKNSVRFLSV